MPRLFATAGPLAGRSFHLLTERPCLIGRDPACGLVLGETTASRRHAEIASRPGGRFAVRDLDSHNGTFVNDERIREDIPLLAWHFAEREAIHLSPLATGGRRGEAARLLGISWPTLRRKIKEHGLDGPPR